MLFVRLLFLAVCCNVWFGPVVADLKSVLRRSFLTLGAPDYVPIKGAKCGPAKAIESGGVAVKTVADAQALCDKDPQCKMFFNSCSGNYAFMMCDQVAGVALQSKCGSVLYRKKAKPEMLEWTAETIQLAFTRLDTNGNFLLSSDELQAAVPQDSAINAKSAKATSKAVADLITKGNADWAPSEDEHPKSLNLQEFSVALLE